MMTRATSTTISPSTLRAITWNTPWSSGVRYLESIPTCNDGDSYKGSFVMSGELVQVLEVSKDFLSRLRDRTLVIRISSGLTKYVNMHFLKWVERNARSEFFFSELLLKITEAGTLC